jgi:hypothetical protein
VNRTFLHVVAGLVAAWSLLACRAPSPPPMAQDRATSEGRVQVDEVITAYFTDPMAARLYAGSYLDDQGRTVVLVTGELEEVRAALLAQLPSDDAVRVSQVRFSLADLDRIVDALSQGLNGPRESGVAVTSVAVDEQANRVVVGLLEDTKRARRTVLALLPPADQHAVTFELTGVNVLE